MAAVCELETLQRCALADLLLQLPPMGAWVSHRAPGREARLHNLTRAGRMPIWQLHRCCIITVDQGCKGQQRRRLPSFYPFIGPQRSVGTERMLSALAMPFQLLCMTKKPHRDSGTMMGDGQRKGTPPTLPKQGAVVNLGAGLQEKPGQRLGADGAAWCIAYRHPGHAGLRPSEHPLG